METAFRSEESFTQEDFWEWLQRLPTSDVHHYELIGGHIVMSPPAGWPHGGVEAALVGLIGAHVRQHRLGLTLGSSAGYDLPSGDTLEPDVSFISTERFAAGPAPVRGRFLKIVPDLVVEILSDSTERRDRTEKLESYARSGVDECWLVDTARREILLFHREGAGFGPPEVVSGGRIPSRVLAGFTASVEDVFVDLL